MLKLTLEAFRGFENERVLKWYIDSPGYDKGKNIQSRNIKPLTTVNLLNRFTYFICLVNISKKGRSNAA